MSKSEQPKSGISRWSETSVDLQKSDQVTAIVEAEERQEDRKTGKTLKHYRLVCALANGAVRRPLSDERM